MRGPLQTSGLASNGAANATALREAIRPDWAIFASRIRQPVRSSRSERRVRPLAFRLLRAAAHRQPKGSREIEREGFTRVDVSRLPTYKLPKVTVHSTLVALLA